MEWTCKMCEFQTGHGCSWNQADPNPAPCEWEEEPVSDDPAWWEEDDDGRES